MHRNKFLVVFFALFMALVVALSGCAKVEEGAAPVASSDKPGNAGGKIAVTTSSEDARKEFLLGRDLQEKLQVQDSIQHYDKAISLDPNFALAELNRAQVSPTGKEFFDHMKKAVALADKASNGEKLLIQANEAGANGNVAKQKELLDQLMAAFPNDERAHFNVGGYYFGQQDFPKAIEHYKKATEIAPTYSTAFNILGYAYRQNDDNASAEQAFKKYIELIPNDPNPYDSLAELYLKMGRFDESIVQYRKALAIYPNFINSHQGIKDNAALFHHYNLTRVALAKKDLTTAKTEAEAFRKGTETAKNPFQTKQAHELLGMIALEAKDFDGALADLQQSNLQNPYDLYRICQAYQGKGDAGKAKEFCNKAATFNSLPQLNLAFIRTRAAKA